ncbi:MAG TPA: YqgE/AlgH family protein [Methylomirabilota bacterium]|nr:YqgE/AlgH family protein [Methylomirabilota bacterium]
MERPAASDDPGRPGGRLTAAPAALLLAVALVVAAVTDGGAETPGRRSLAGRLLVATEAMRDPRFARTVLYLVRHNDKGAFGLVINLPVAEVPFEQALRPFSLEVPPGSGDVRVHYGGPVDQRRGFVLHTPEWAGEGTTVVDGGLALTEDPAVLQAMARGTGPRRALFCLGYAGWAPGQLDAELATGAWAVARADERLVFDEDPSQKWIEAMTRRILDL